MKETSSDCYFDINSHFTSQQNYAKDTARRTKAVNTSNYPLPWYPSNNCCHMIQVQQLPDDPFPEEKRRRMRRGLGMCCTCWLHLFVVLSCTCLFTNAGTADYCRCFLLKLLPLCFPVTKLQARSKPLMDPTVALWTPMPPCWSNFSHFHAVFGNNLAKQECIPVGCIPSAAVAAGGCIPAYTGQGVCPGGVCRGGVGPGGVCLGESAQGVSARGHAGIHPPPVNRMTDRQ